MNSEKPMDKPDRMRILCADLSLRCPGFAILRYEDGKAAVEKLCHLDSRGSKAGHGEILSAIYDLMVE